jgi:hypothetical protein
MLSNIFLNVMLSVVMLIFYVVCHDECYYVMRHNDDCCYAKCCYNACCHTSC